MALALAFVGLNLVGIKEAGRVQVALVVGLLVLLVGYIALGIPHVEVTRFEGFADRGWTPVFATAGFVFVSFGGLLKVASIAEEVKNPARTVPLGMILSLVIVTTIYLLAVFVTQGVLSADTLSVFSGE